MRSHRKILPLVVFAIASLMSLGSIAWACTVQPSISANPRSAEPGQVVTITGIGMPFRGQVEVRWNTLDGPILTTVPHAAKLNFEVTVPADAAPGVYYIVAQARMSMGGSLQGGAIWKASDTFEVSASGASGAGLQPLLAAQSSTSDLWGGLASGADPLGNTLAETPAQPNESSRLVSGLGLLAVGLTGLLAGSAVALRHKRRRSI